MHACVCVCVFWFYCVSNAIPLYRLFFIALIDKHAYLSFRVTRISICSCFQRMHTYTALKGSEELKKKWDKRKSEVENSISAVGARCDSA